MAIRARKFQKEGFSLLNQDIPMSTECELSWTPSTHIVRAGNARLLLDDSEGNRAIVKEIWEWNVYRYHPRPNDIVLDIGANTGVFTVWAALHGAFVHAYEPCRTTYENLLMNVKMNGLETRVCARNMGLWSQACRLPLYYWPADPGGHSLVENSRRDSEDVLCTTFDELMTHIKTVDFLKMDVEGSEQELLTYVSDDILDRISAMSVEIHSPALDPGGREHPVKFTAYKDEAYAAIVSRLEKHFGTVEELRARNGDPNYLFCRKETHTQW